MTTGRINQVTTSDRRGQVLRAPKKWIALSLDQEFFSFTRI